MTEAALQRTKKSCYQFSVIHTAKIKQPFVFIYLAKLIPSLFSLYLSATTWNSLTHFTCAHCLLLSFLHTTWVNQHHYLLKLPTKSLFYSAIAHPCPETCPCRGRGGRAEQNCCERSVPARSKSRNEQPDSGLRWEQALRRSSLLLGVGELLKPQFTSGGKQPKQKMSSLVLLCMRT